MSRILCILQLEKAGETFRKLKRPLEASRCYEQLGKFNMAVETLVENDLYEIAIDTLKRYTRLKEVSWLNLLLFLFIYFVFHNSRHQEYFQYFHRLVTCSCASSRENEFNFSCISKPYKKCKVIHDLFMHKNYGVLF